MSLKIQRSQQPEGTMPDEIKPPAPPSFGVSFWESFKNFFAKIWASVRKLSPKILGPLAALVVIVTSVILVSMGFKELQIGGLLGKLLGKKGGVNSDLGPTVETANSIDPKRVGPDGKVIQEGVPDQTGSTQAVVVPIKPPGLFSDPNTVVFTAPGEDKSTTVVLPTGVTNKQVDQVVVINQTTVAVTVRDNTGLPVSKVDDLLKKYGK
jgi:hypothetical protein